MKQKAILLYLILLLLPAGARSHALTVADMAGRSVQVPADPDRIACLGPGALRLMVYLRAETKVCGVEAMETAHPGGRPYWLAHPELGRLPRCGPGGAAAINKKPDLEALLSAAPQVVFATYMKKRLADEVQAILNIPVVVLSYGALATFDETVYDALKIAGRVLNRNERARAVVDYVQRARADLKNRTKTFAGAGRPTVYVGGVGYRGAHGIESSQRHYAPLEWTGADQVAANLQSGIAHHLSVSRETLLELDPQIIFIDGAGLALVAGDYRKKTCVYNALQAFSGRNVFVLHPFNWYATNIGTALADAYAVGKILCPEGFADIDPERKADEIYQYLVGKPVYAKMKEAYGPIGRRASFLD